MKAGLSISLNGASQYCNGLFAKEGMDMENSVQQAETAGGADAGTAQVEAAPALMAETKAGTTVPQKTAAAEEDRRSANDMTLLAVRLRTAMAKIGMT